MAESIKITVNIADATRLTAWAQQLKTAPIKLVQDAFRQSLNTVKNAERVRTGNMRNQTTVTTSGTGAEIIAAAPYSGFQDQGTKYFEGTHFMEAGLSSITQYIQQNINTAITPK